MGFFFEKSTEVLRPTSCAGVEEELGPRPGRERMRESMFRSWAAGSTTCPTPSSPRELWRSAPTAPTASGEALGQQCAQARGESCGDPRASTRGFRSAAELHKEGKVPCLVPSCGSLAPGPCHHCPHITKPGQLEELPRLLTGGDLRRRLHPSSHSLMFRDAKFDERKQDEQQQHLPNSSGSSWELPSPAAPLKSY